MARQEQWFRDLVHAVKLSAGDDTRAQVKNAWDTFTTALCPIKTEIKKALKEARKGDAYVSDDDDDDDDEADDSPGSSGYTKARNHRLPLCEVSVSGIDIKVVNDLRFVALHVAGDIDCSSRQFIKSKIVPAIAEAGRKVAVTKTGTHPHGKRTADPGSIFDTETMPNVFNRVRWVPSASQWSVFLTPKDKAGRADDDLLFRVTATASGLGGRKRYLAEKFRQYLAAMKTWNEWDSSRRDRIIIPATPVALQGALDTQ